MNNPNAAALHKLIASTLTRTGPAMFDTATDLPTLRKIWSALVRETKAQTGETGRAITASIIASTDQPIEGVYALFHQLHSAQTVSTGTGRFEWNTTGFGDRVREQIYTHDESAFEATCARVLAAVA